MPGTGHVLGRGATLGAPTHESPERQTDAGADAEAPVPARLTTGADPGLVRVHGLGP